MSRGLAVATLAAFAAAAAPGCFESGCHITTHCEGNDLHYCRVDNDTGSTELRTHCAADGRVWRQNATAPDGVFPDEPCTDHACAGDQVAECTPLGLVGSHTDCTREEPGRTCFDGVLGPTCGYPAITCPTSGADPFCGPDGVSRFSGCYSDEHPLHREDCSAYDGDVCTTANGVAGCVNPDFIPCTASANFCSADFTIAYSCGTTGLVWRIEDCAAYGQICKDGWCGHV